MAQKSLQPPPSPETVSAFRVHRDSETRLQLRKAKYPGAPDYHYAVVPTHPAADRWGRVLLHRLVMEEHLGRYLYPWEVVHHENGHGLDNRPENLRLFASQTEHAHWHQRQCKRRQPAWIDVVKKFAADPTKRVQDVPLSPQTVLEIC